jgi:hypothetical protein
MFSWSYDERPGTASGAFFAREAGIRNPGSYPTKWMRRSSVIRMPLDGSPGEAVYFMD